MMWGFLKSFLNFNHKTDLKNKSEIKHDSIFRYQYSSHLIYKVRDYLINIIYYRYALIVVIREVFHIL